MSIEFMGDPYAAQLRAAKAEGELAAVRDALRDFAEDNGLNPEMEPRDLLAKAAGAFRSCAAMSDARYAEIRELKAEMEAMRPRLMPEGIEWPRYENGEPVKPGSWLQDNDGEAFEAVSFVFTCDWWGIHGYRPDRYGTIGTKYRRQLDGMAYGTHVKRPAVLAADGEPLEAGQTREWWGRKAKETKERGA